MSGRLHGDNIAYFADGTIQHKYQYNEGAKTGTSLEYHPNGKIKTREQVTLNGIDSKEEGFSDTGTQLYEKNFRKLKPHGTWVYFFEDGKTTKLKENYENGKLQGIRTTFYPSGNKSLEESYQINLITGPVKNYYEDGKLLSVCEYKSSRQHGLYTSFYPNGQIKEQGEYVANRKHKEWKEFDEKGNVIKTYLFKAGILVETK